VFAKTDSAFHRYMGTDSGLSSTQGPWLRDAMFSKSQCKKSLPMVFEQ
jgi:hypothetical protein